VSDIDVDFIIPFVKATDKVFESMLGTKVQHRQLYIKEGYRMPGDITAIIGMCGTIAGTCAISLPEQLAVKCVENILGEPVKEGIRDTVVQDGIGEFINMIAGQAKALLSRTKYKFDITLPTIISGRGHEVFNRKGTQCIVIVFETSDNVTFTIEVCHAKPKT